MRQRAKKIESTAEAWEEGALGRDASHARAAPINIEQQVDDGIGLQLISIRLPKELIEDYKKIAEFHAIGYQPLMRDALKHFAEAEYKRIAIEYTKLKRSR
ncbi:hypothetical protein RugamoR64_40930 [Duganella rhizosphaerae]|uniref:hypothetical protein n=1 Tax=Duganella rhizosphaerae TaxID=2885763 RepID=UPI0030EAE6FD